MSGLTAAAFRSLDGILPASGFYSKDRELVLGRGTDQVFGGGWPDRSDDNPIANSLNATWQHLASRALTMLQGDVASAFRALLAQSGLDLRVTGSGRAERRRWTETKNSRHA